MIDRKWQEIVTRRLNEKFKEKDITQKYLSDLSGVPASRIYNYLHARVFPRGDDIEKIAEVLDTTSDYLFGFDEYCYNGRKEK